MRPGASLLGRIPLQSNYLFYEEGQVVRSGMSHKRFLCDMVLLKKNFPLLTKHNKLCNLAIYYSPIPPGDHQSRQIITHSFAVPSAPLGLPRPPFPNLHPLLVLAHIKAIICHPELISFCSFNKKFYLRKDRI